ncbi:MAG: ABC transporter permease [Candidatus Cloacimonetes bacterium HGW-Cloacimonetes-3]|jgi:ABC-type lipoprotein release transport system permease subunit|nr:MAG: ABC transporter permease [Candidatus Cloacimonetes bacterium HGW-Cloacimonetes-3]
MILKLAYKNILGNGWRSLINVIILSIVLTGMIWMQGLYDGWGRIARRQMIAWQFGSGHYEQVNYDKYDSFTLDKSNAALSPEMEKQVADGKAVPILYSAGVIYPQGRMTPVVIKGIPTQQSILAIPTEYLKIADKSAPVIPVIIGKQMAKSTRLSEGDQFTMRWKDIYGVFNAYDVVIAKVMNTPVPTTDVAQVWMDYDKLNEVKALNNSATLIVLKDKPVNSDLGSDWRYLSTDDSMAGTDAMISAKRVGGYVIFTLLLFLAMVAIFDTQILSIFKRRKEIGTLIALGLTKRQIIRLFTLEGTLYMLLGTVFTGIFGMPLFLYFGIKGYSMPVDVSSYNIAGMSDSIKCYYSPIMIISTFLIVMLVTVFASWLPTARIARMKATDALLGKV